MMAKTHIAFGFLAGALTLKFIGISNQLSFMAFVLIGSLLADIDTPQSKLGRKIKPLSNIFSFLFGHRGIFHSIWAPLALVVVYAFFVKHILILALVVGYVSHLLIDGFTKQGVNFLHPIADLKLSGFIETNTFIETILFAVIIALDVMLVFRLG